MDNARSFAIQKFAVDLLESIDNFDRALSVVPADKLADGAEANKDLLELHQGLKMTENILLNTLKKHGLERFDPSDSADGKPSKFDPKLHEATFMAKVEGKENGDIMFVQSKGYSLNGRVLRVSLYPIVRILATDKRYSRPPKSVLSRTIKRHFDILLFSSTVNPISWRVYDFLLKTVQYFRLALHWGRLSTSSVILGTVDS